MTRRRKQILYALEDCANNGQRVRLAELARRCGLYDYRDARRIIRDLRVMGHVK